MGGACRGLARGDSRRPRDGDPNGIPAAAPGTIDCGRRVARIAGGRACCDRPLKLIVPEFGIRSVANDLEEMAAQFGAFYLVDVGVADVVGLGRFDAVRAAVVASAVFRNLDAFLQRLGPDLGELPGHANAAGVVLVVEDGRRILGRFRVGTCVEPVCRYDEHRAYAKQVLKSAYRASVGVLEARNVQ